MYHEGRINAFFFASTDIQQTVPVGPAHQWEPVYLPNILMCKNWCNAECTFSDTVSNPLREMRLFLLD